MGKLEEREGRRRSAVAGFVGQKRPPDRERKRRVCLALKPSAYKDLQKVCFMERKSVSEVVGDMMEAYVKEREELLREYDSLDEDEG